MEKQKQSISRFASLLGTSGSSCIKERDILFCFSNSVGADDIVCSVPSLDMKVGDESDVLPKVGEHRKELSSNNHLQKLNAARPVMEVSVLNNTVDANADAAALEQKAAERLCTKSSWTKSTICYAPHALSKNVGEAFTTLVDSRVRAWTLLLFRHSLSSGDSTSRSRLLSMLSAKIKVNSALTTLKTLPLPENAASQANISSVILPLLFEAKCEIELQHRTDKVTLRAPGTILGTFEKNDTGESTANLCSVNINLDTGALLSSMVDQARLAVFRTVAKISSNDDAVKAMAMMPKISKVMPPPSSAKLSSFSSSLRLTATKAAQGENGGVPKLEKARHSALRLNSVLHGKSFNKVQAASSLVGSRKNRSVQWNHPMQLPTTPNSVEPSPKRLRMTHTSAQLKSIKSFGRPHAGDFGSGARNATFGEFGGAATWGRNGKMVHAPSPVNSVRRDFLDPGAGLEPGRNASFSKLSSARQLKNYSINGLSSKPLNNSSSTGLSSKLLKHSSIAGLTSKLLKNSTISGLSRNSNNNSVSRFPKSIPRTATESEALYLRYIRAKQNND